MGKLAEAYVEINSRTKGFDEGVDKSTKSLESFVAKSNSLLAAAGLAMGGGAMFSFFKGATEKGSDLIETMNKVEQVFGKATGTVTAMANDMADKFGAVKNTTLGAASNLGLVAQGAGLSAQASADLSVKLTRLADDASSFFNVPLDVALEKIRSGLVGEAEPLRAFGVLLSDANMKQAALKMGMMATNRELTEQEKVLARVQIITEGLNKAQGDHARTMDGYANQIKKLTGEWENYQANIGAGISGALAAAGAEVRKESVIGGLANLLQNAFNVAIGRESTFQQASDVAAGVIGGGIKVERAETQPERFARERAAYDEHLRQLFEERDRQRPRFGGGMAGFMGMGVGLLAPDLALRALRENQERIRDLKAGGWAGSNVMSATEWQRTAQETLLRHEDPDRKKQIAELEKINKTLEVIAGKPGANQMAPGMKFRQGARDM